ncbi:hypothetical protein JCM6882_009756 [Rhodosporidiobolus microsporus]
MDLSSPPPDLFGKLPLELLKHIVALVKVQDDAFSSAHLTQGVEPRVDSDDEDDGYDEDDGADASKGRWGPWYGAGVRALSLCDKRTRESCLPHLFETVTPTKLDDVFFKVGMVTDALCRHVRHLRISWCPEEGFVATAAAFFRLPNLERLSISNRDFINRVLETDSQLDEVWRAEKDPQQRKRLKKMVEDRNNTMAAFKTVAKRITEIDLFGGAALAVEDVLRGLAEPASLRKLRIRGRSTLAMLTNGTSAEAFAPFTFTTLLIDDSQQARAPYFNPISDPAWEDKIVRMPALSFLTIHLPDNWRSNLIFVKTFAPGLKSLHLLWNEHPNASVAREPFRVHLPHLTHLIVTGHLCTANLLPLFIETPLHTASFRFRDTADERILLREAFRADFILPPTLRHLHIEVLSLNRPEDVSSFREHLAARGVTLSFSWTTVDGLTAVDFWSPHNASLGLHHFDPAYSRAEQKAAIRSTLDWASRRLEWLSVTGDWAGVEELAESLTWTRQRQVIEEQ